MKVGGQETNQYSQSAKDDVRWREWFAAMAFGPTAGRCYRSRILLMCVFRIL